MLEFVIGMRCVLRLSLLQFVRTLICTGGGTQENVGENTMGVRLPLPFPNEGQ